MSDRAILRFYIAPSWDGRQYVNYVYAPDDWADMDEAQREKFLSKESAMWMDQNIEYGATVHNPDEAPDPWEQGGDPSEPEEMF